MKSGDIRAALRRAYPAPEYAILFEVADSTGARHSRFADAVVMSLWPSRGLGVDGFEIKISRGDWLREKADPKKAEAVAKYCDFWWMVAPKSLIKPEELPQTWGLKEVSDTGEIRTVKPAEKLEAQPLDRLFVASLLRNAGKVDDAEVAAQVNARLEGLVQREIKARERWNAEAKSRYAKLDEMLKDLNGEGVWIDDAEVLAAVRAVISSGVVRSYGGLLVLEENCRKMADGIAAVMGSMGMPKARRAKR